VLGLECSANAAGEALRRRPAAPSIAMRAFMTPTLTAILGVLYLTGASRTR